MIVIAECDGDGDGDGDGGGMDTDADDGRRGCHGRLWHHGCLHLDCWAIFGPINRQLTGWHVDCRIWVPRFSGDMRRRFLCSVSGGVVVVRGSGCSRIVVAATLPELGRDPQRVSRAAARQRGCARRQADH